MNLNIRILNSVYLINFSENYIRLIIAYNLNQHLKKSIYGIMVLIINFFDYSNNLKPFYNS